MPTILRTGGGVWRGLRMQPRDHFHGVARRGGGVAPGLLARHGLQPIHSVTVPADRGVPGLSPGSASGLFRQRERQQRWPVHRTGAVREGLPVRRRQWRRHRDLPLVLQRRRWVAVLRGGHVPEPDGLGHRHLLDVRWLQPRSILGAHPERLRPPNSACARGWASCVVGYGIGAVRRARFYLSRSSVRRIRVDAVPVMTSQGDAGPLLHRDDPDAGAVRLRRAYLGLPVQAPLAADRSDPERPNAREAGGRCRLSPGMRGLLWSARAARRITLRRTASSTPPARPSPS